MKCPTCGTENDAANRFCDQCGSRLDAGAAAPSSQVALAAQPTAAAATCPSCGAVVLPGEAFCDECGASLSGVAVPSAASAASYDAPTVYAPPMPSGAASTAAPAGAQGPVCPACGHHNLPEDRFCDNCGAALPTASAPGGAGDPSAPAEAPPQPREAPPAESPVSKTEPPQKSASSDLPTAEQPALPNDASYQAEKQRLEDEIARQQQIITQFEQMQAMFGAAAPPAVTQGLAEARDMLARAQVALAELKPPAPPVDPAEVKRLEDEVARQQQIITQFEQMQAMFGAAVPAAVTQGLAEARDGLARAQAELQALAGTGTVVPTAAPAAPVETPAAPEPATLAPAPEGAASPPEEAAPSPVSAPIAESPASPADIPAVEPPPAAQPAPQAAAAPRLVLDESGKELPLPTDKAEIIVGREDPISGIFPEIDLTPYGGEGGGVSRQHARISRANGQWTITDLNSTNYTRVDGNKLDPSLPAPIKDGARIQFGRIAVTFRE
jgi:uncharacterized OB-fold protein